MNADKIAKFKTALEFLRNHPAFAFDDGSSPSSGLYFGVDVCCKNGISEYYGLEGIWIHPDETEMYNKYFDQYHEEGDIRGFNDIVVPYNVIYGYPWKADHLSYWGETTFFTFTGNPYKPKDVYNINKWSRYGCEEAHGDTFEDMIIDAAEKIKVALGVFSCETDFYTEAEKANNADQPSCFFKDIEDQPNLKLHVHNDKYVDVTNGLINLRWLKWFIETPYAKKNWDWEIKRWKRMIQKIESREPFSRKELLAQYEK